MNPTRRHIALYSMQLFLMLFWLYVAIDKLWSLSEFHTALLRQPFPDSWAAILYWLLPFIELALGLALVMSAPRYNNRHAAKINDVGISRLMLRTAFLLSAILLSIFTLYIALGVLGLYPKRPCGCASVFKSINWNQHLLVNLFLLALSILGWYLTGPTAPVDRAHRNRDTASRAIPSTHASQEDASSTAMIHAVSLFKRYRMLFNLFPVGG